MSAREKAADAIERSGYLPCHASDQVNSQNARGIADALAEAGLLLDKGVLLDVLSKSKARAEKAERERDKAVEALARVEALAEAWRYKGEFGWGSWQEGDGPDQEGYVLDTAAALIRDALRGDDA